MRTGALLLAAVTLLAAAAVLLSGILVAPAQPTDAQRVQALAGQLRCPDCQSLSVAESRTAAAAAIRGEIEQQVAAGRSDEAVRRYFTDRYGEWILLAPPEPLLWALPAAAVLAGLVGLAAWFRFARRPAQAPVAARPLEDAELSRINDELEALDG